MKTYNRFKPKGIRTVMAQQRPPMDEWLKEFNYPTGGYGVKFGITTHNNITRLTNATKMKLSEKYFDRITTITDFDQQVSIYEAECKRYGQYCRLEERKEICIKINDFENGFEASQQLKAMAKEDNLTI